MGASGRGELRGLLPQQVLDLKCQSGEVFLDLGLAAFRKGTTVFRSALHLLQPVDGLPGAGADDERDDPEPILGAALEEAGNFRAADEIGNQEIGRDQQHGGLGARHGLLDLRAPVVTRGDLLITPDRKDALDLQNAQLADELVLPGFVLMAVADEDRRSVHGVFRETRRL